jgi:hypothetical protein
VDVASGSRTVLSPQYAAGGGLWKSVLTILNLEAAETRVTLSLWLDDGTQAGSAFSVDVPAGGRFVMRDPTPFGLPAVPESLLQGYVRIESSVTRVAGSVQFGDPASSKFQTALPCVSQATTDLLFSQVAQDDTWFTGLAVTNPDPNAAQITVTVYRTDGTPAASGAVSVPPNGRFSKLLTQIVTDMPQLTRGYFVVHSDRPVFGFAVFGTHSLSVLSAIPPQ